jgi:hypothetical protein
MPMPRRQQRRDRPKPKDEQATRSDLFHCPTVSALLRPISALQKSTVRARAHLVKVKGDCFFDLHQRRSTSGTLVVTE